MTWKQDMTKVVFIDKVFYCPFDHTTRYSGCVHNMTLYFDSLIPIKCSTYWRCLYPWPRQTRESGAAVLTRALRDEYVYPWPGQTKERGGYTNPGPKRWRCVSLAWADQGKWGGCTNIITYCLIWQDNDINYLLII